MNAEAYRCNQVNFSAKQTPQTSVQSKEIIEGGLQEFNEKVNIASLPLLPDGEGTEQTDPLHFQFQQRVVMIPESAQDFSSG